MCVCSSFALSCVCCDKSRTARGEKGERVALLGFPLEILLKEEPDIEGDEVENFSALNVSLLY